MTDYIVVRLADPDRRQAINEWLRRQPEDAVLEEYDWRFRFTPMGEQICFGVLKRTRGHLRLPMSGHSETFETAVFPAWVALLGRLHDHDRFDIEIVVDSGGLQPGEYLSAEQVCRITDDGAALVGDGAATLRAQLAGGSEATDSTDPGFDRIRASSGTYPSSHAAVSGFSRPGIVGVPFVIQMRAIVSQTRGNHNSVHVGSATSLLESRADGE